MKRKLLSCLLVCAMLLAPGAALAAEEDAPALSDDLYSFQLMIDGELYAFPMSFADFTAMGWEYDGDETETLSPNQYTVAERFEKDGLEIYAAIANLGINTAAYADSVIGGVSLDRFFYDDISALDFTLPGGLKVGTATEEDIKAAYGTPTDTYEGDMYTKLTYEYDYYRQWELYVYPDSGVLEEFEVKNLVEDEEANAAAAAQVSDEPTEEALAYEAPEELGEDILSFRVEYAGDLYQLPAPVSVFLENGWTVKAESSETVIVGDGYGWVSLMKDNQELRCTVRNYGPDATVIANCFVTDVETDEYGPNLALTLPGGVTMDMAEEDVAAALEGLEYELDDDSSSYAYYTVEDPDSAWNHVTIRIDKETGKVVGIEVTYEPDELA